MKGAYAPVGNLKNKTDKTMKNTIAILATSIALAASMTTTQAAFVNGNIGFTGLANLNTSSANTATAVTSWSSTAVLGRSGDFLVIPNGTSATFAAPWNFNSGAVANFWTVTSGGQTFTFNLTSSAIVSQGGGSVTVNGTGFVSGSGTTVYQATLMNWSFTSQDPNTGQGFTFSASTSAVPEPSTVVAGALLLLPFGVSTLRILRRNKNS